MNALERAVSYLNVKPRTRMQVIRYLQGKGYGDGDISEAVAELEQYNYIDDRNFARLYFELGFEKGRGEARIRRELAEKGVPRDIIDEAFEELEDIPDPYETALEIGRNVVGTRVGDDELSYEEKQKLQAKIARKLANRGFSGEIAYRAARELVK